MQSIETRPTFRKVEQTDMTLLATLCSLHAGMSVCAFILCLHSLR
jgi:hypothetical protein